MQSASEAKNEVGLGDAACKRRQKSCRTRIGPMQSASEARSQETHNTRPSIDWLRAFIVGTSSATDSQGKG
jgi:hypothetical protein